MININEENQNRIAEHRSQIPKQYRTAYDRAMKGKSRQAAMKSFCLACCGWVIKDVFLCTSPECPLYSYRPRSKASQGTPQGFPVKPGSTKTKQGDIDG